jgi:hypothetical protein
MSLSECSLHHPSRSSPTGSNASQIPVQRTHPLRANQIATKMHKTEGDCRDDPEAPAMPQVRFTVRRLMIAVAVVAVVLSAGLEAARLARISAARRRYASSCAASAALSSKFALSCSQTAEAVRKQADSLRSRPALGVGRIWPASREAAQPGTVPLAEQWDSFVSLREGTAARYSRNAAHWALVSRKYERAGWTPWREVEPDPPAPF